MSNKDFIDIDIAKVDIQRSERNGYPEVIYGEGKTADQIIEISKVLLSKDKTVLATRVSEEKISEIYKAFPDAVYDKEARCMSLNKKDTKKPDSYIAIVTAGTSDIPVAKEAAFCADVFGNNVECIYDVGVAGIHRLFACLDTIRNAKVIIVIAGMEGALASVVCGLVDKPVIAVPTSVGYGTSLNGITALLSMLNSCASGLSVVNIDNGFGAAYNASMINHL
ncbi:nickel pincer cofactor biosynthesis protein LarB [Terrisporobacter sp.]